MIPVRFIPCLLLRNTGLVKTIKFRDPVYVGDPRNAVKIFNDKEVDELILLDISVTPAGRGPQFQLVQEIAEEAFMPVGYGGGVRSVEDCQRLFGLGVEKVCLNTAAVTNPELVRAAAERFGNQSIVVSIDARRKMFGRYEVMIEGGRKGTGQDPQAAAEAAQKLGAGELLINSIDRDGTMTGYDLELVGKVAKAVDIPVVACGGAGSVAHLREAIAVGGASAAAAGSMFVFQGKHRAVLINFPSPAELAGALPGVG